MNENFIAAVKKSHKSQYQIAQESGVPFSTINALMNKRQSVNKCATATVLRLASIMDFDFLELLDPYSLLDKTVGEYKGVKYKWEDKNGSMVLLFKYDSESVQINTGLSLNIPSKQNEYHYIAEWNIDSYIEQKEFEKHAKELTDVIK